MCRTLRTTGLEKVRPRDPVEALRHLKVTEIAEGVIQPFKRFLRRSELTFAFSRPVPPQVVRVLIKEVAVNARSRAR